MSLLGSSPTHARTHEMTSYYQLGACYLADPGTGSLLVVEEHGACPRGKRPAEHICQSAEAGRGWRPPYLPYISSFSPLYLAEAGGRP